MKSDLNTPVNIGNPEEFKIIDLANKIKEIINPELEFIFKPLPEDDPLQRKPDITQAKTKLNWQPKVNLNDGINKTIDWFKKTYFE